MPQQKVGKILVWDLLHPDPSPPPPTPRAWPLISVSLTSMSLQQRKQHHPSLLIPPSMVDLHLFPLAISPGMRVWVVMLWSHHAPCIPPSPAEKPSAKTELRPGFRVLPREATKKADLSLALETVHSQLSYFLSCVFSLT